MGRGRAKAKQTKVARDLKYNHPGTDLDRLARELGVRDSGVDDADGHHTADDDEYEDDYDGYSRDDE
jgi:hypothetical protein